MTHTAQPSNDGPDHAARQDFYLHFLVFAVSNIFIIIFDALNGDLKWFYWALIGWGSLIVLHAFYAFGAERLVHRVGDRRLHEDAVAGSGADDSDAV